MAFPFHELIAGQGRLQDFIKVVLNSFTIFFHHKRIKESKNFAFLSQHCQPLYKIFSSTSSTKEKKVNSYI